MASLALISSPTARSEAAYTHHLICPHGTTLSRATHARRWHKIATYPCRQSVMIVALFCPHSLRRALLWGPLSRCRPVVLLWRSRVGRALYCILKKCAFIAIHDHHPGKEVRGMWPSPYHLLPNETSSLQLQSLYLL